MIELAEENVHSDVLSGINDLTERLRKRAEIRLQITTRKSVQENQPDRIADLLVEAADKLDALAEELIDMDTSYLIKIFLLKQDSKTREVYINYLKSRLDEYSIGYVNDY